MTFVSVCTTSDFTPPSEADVVEGGFGSLHVWSPRPMVVCTRAAGVLDGDMAQLVLSKANAALLLGTGLVIWHHWLDVKSYTPQVRKAFVQWGMTNMPKCEGFHFLSGKNRLLNMGVGLASAVVAGVHIYENEEDFGEAFRSVNPHTKTRDTP